MPGRNRRDRRGVRNNTGAVVVDSSMYGVGSFTTNDFFASANPGGESGVNADFGMIYVLRPGASGGIRMLSARSPYDVRIDASNRIQVVVGAFTSPLYTIAGGDASKWLHWAWQFDKTGSLLRTFAIGVEVGAGTAMATFSPTSNPTYVGKRADGFPGAGVALAGVVQYRGLATAGELAAHYAACKAARDVVPMTGAAVTNTHRYSARYNRASVAVLSDLVGTDTLTATGVPTLIRDTAPAWV